MAMNDSSGYIAPRPKTDMVVYSRRNVAYTPYSLTTSQTCDNVLTLMSIDEDTDMKCDLCSINEYYMIGM